MTSYVDKLKNVSDIREKIRECIYSSSYIIWIRFIIPMMVFILILLGAVQTVYPYESTFQEDLNASIGAMGMSVYSIYNIGAENPNWLYYSIIVFIVLGYLALEEVYHNVKEVWSGVRKMDAQEIIDTIKVDKDSKGYDDVIGLSKLKGGKRYKNDSINNR